MNDTTGQVKTNIALADKMNETVISNMIPVNFTATAMKKALNIADNPTNINRHVYIRGDLTTYYSVAGLKNADAYRFWSKPLFTGFPYHQSSCDGFLHDGPHDRITCEVGMYAVFR